MEDGVDLKINLKLDDESIKRAMAGLERSIGGVGQSKGPEQAAQNFEKLQKKVEEASVDIKELVSVEKFEKFRGVLGDVRDAFDLSAKSLLGLNEQQTKAISEGGYLVEKGIAIGATFGPLGAFIGGATGALIGYTKASRDAAKAVKEHAEAEREKNEQTRISVLGVQQSLERLAAEAGGDEFGVKGLGFAALKKGAGDTALEISAIGHRAKKAAEEYNELVKSGKASAKQEEEAKAALSVYTDQYDRAKREQTAYANAIEQANKDMEETASVTEVVGAKIDTLPPKLKGAGNAAKEAAKDIERYGNAILYVDRAREKASKEQQGRGDFITGLVGGDIDIKKTGADLIDFMDADGKIRERAEDDYLINRAKWDRVELDMEQKKLKAIQHMRDEAAQRAASAMEMQADAIDSVIESTTKTILTALGDGAVKGVNAFYDNLANNEHKSKEERQRSRAEWMRDIGTKLMIDGESHIVMGTVNAAAHRPGGVAEIIGGINEAGIGASLGGIGAIRQRALGGTADNDGARGVRGGGADGSPRVSDLDNIGGTKDLRPLVINITNGLPATERGMQEQAKMISDSIDRRRK